MNAFTLKCIIRYFFLCMLLIVKIDFPVFTSIIMCAKSYDIVYLGQVMLGVAKSDRCQIQEVYPLIRSL